VSRELVIGVLCGLIAGVWLSLATSPTTAIAQSSTGTPGLYQIQVATGMAQAGTSPIWRVNTATGALDFCTFTNVNLSGGSINSLGLHFHREPRKCSDGDRHKCSAVQRVSPCSQYREPRHSA
jgi:hypothetical protein